MYRNLSFHGRPGRVATGEFKRYKQQIEYMREPIRRSLGKLPETTWLIVEVRYFFAKHRVYTKKNTVKKLDAHNYLKATLDSVADITGVDDSLFKFVTCFKDECEDTLNECVQVKITPWVSHPIVQA